MNLNEKRRIKVFTLCCFLTSVSLVGREKIISSDFLNFAHPHEVHVQKSSA